MAVVSYEPWSMLQQLRGEMDRFFEDRAEEGAGDWIPPVDVKVEDDRYVIYADLPGVEPADIQIDTEHGVLTLQGNRGQATNEEHNSFKRMERRRGTFLRRFNLPDTADVERITAQCKNGVLELVIPKQEKLQPRRITVEG